MPTRIRKSLFALVAASIVAVAAFECGRVYEAASNAAGLGAAARAAAVDRAAARAAAVLEAASNAAVHRAAADAAAVHRAAADAAAVHGAAARAAAALEAASNAAAHRATAAIDAAVERAVAAIQVARVPAASRFQEIQAEADPSVYLIHCEYTWLRRGDDGRWTENQDSGWGTGFVARDDGLLLTSKHVVQPWKFDEQLAALEAQGLARFVPESVRLAAWPAGTACLDKNRRALASDGFESWQRKNLELVAFAEDRMSENHFDVAGERVTYRVHDPSNEDVAVLRIAGAKVRPLPCARPGVSPALRKLDHVMTLGFPRGERGLENGIAVTSPSLGDVRKVEETIHVTTPLISGNSGGPVFNESGEVVGIATRIFSETLGVCIKIEHGLALLDRVPRSAPEPAAVSGTLAATEAPAAAGTMGF